MGRKVIVVILAGLFLGPWFLNAQQSTENKLSLNRSLLKELNAQIEELRQKILSTKRKESDLEMQIQLIDQEMALLMRSRGLLEQEIQMLQKKISQKEAELQQAEQRLKKLKNLYAARAVYSYKYGRIKPLEVLLGSHSLNQALIRLKYLKQIARHDEHLIRAIEKRRIQISNLKQTLEQALAQKNMAFTEIRKKSHQYLVRKSEKQRLLKQLKSRHFTYQKQLSQKDRERKRLMDLITALEKERLAREKRRQQTPTAPAEAPSLHFENIVQAKGKLPWPVKGKVISRYGLQHGTSSKTYIKNTDIEIKAKPGTPVKCIFPGVVRIITFLPDYGNTVIVYHGKGYYSVYSHLAQVYVYRDMPVKQNQIIGKVGDSGYLGQVSLRFGIYGSNKTYNPERWLE